MNKFIITQFRRVIPLTDIEHIIETCYHDSNVCQPHIVLAILKSGECVNVANTWNPYISEPLLLMFDNFNADDTANLFDVNLQIDHLQKFYDAMISVMGRNSAFLDSTYDYLKERLISGEIQCTLTRK